MAFTGFDEDGDPLFDTKDAAITWARQHIEQADPDAILMIARPWANKARWLAHLLRGTPLERLAYRQDRK
jgi:hypothetical protein